MPCRKPKHSLLERVSALLDDVEGLLIRAAVFLVFLIGLTKVVVDTIRTLLK